MIVGTLEANPSEGKISNESPVGKALLGKKVGDEIVITSPINVKYKIKKIRYEIS
jgi:transcription elongation factor GreA